jgi:hypothetical protein
LASLPAITRATAVSPKGRPDYSPATPQGSEKADGEPQEASLERNKIYAVLPDLEAERDGDFRVVDESGEDAAFGRVISWPSTACDHNSHAVR